MSRSVYGGSELLEMFYRKYGKRILDLLLAAVALVMLVPVFVCLAIVVKLDSKGPVLFRQKRIGVGRKGFMMYKFRTMRMDTPRDVPTHEFQQPGKYITKVGKWMRRTSLDELPQIAQILVGQMSFVGPRPALWNQYDLIAERDKYGANDVLPGLTGLAQISGRDELDIAEKARMDGIYVKNMSFRLDFRCFFKSVLVVLRHDGYFEGGKPVNRDVL